MKIAVLYICTGRYSLFFDGFYNSCELYFLNGIADKEYFVWTDDDSIGEGKDKVHIQHKECEGFPYDSLFRFEMFIQVERELEQFDYVYFFNANALFRAPVYEEILPDVSGLVAGVWPDVQRRHPMFFPYERNKQSLAYVAPRGADYVYYMGGLNGGRRQEYLIMINELAHNIRDDFSRGIIARVHDESHLNAYLRKHKCKKLGESFCWPEEWGISDLNKIVFRDKVGINPYFNKGRNNTLWSKIKKGFSYFINAVRWYL